MKTMAPTTTRRKPQKSTPTTRKIITRSIYKKEQLLLHTQKPPKKSVNNNYILDSDSGFHPKHRSTSNNTNNTNNNNNKSNSSNSNSKSSANGGGISSGDLCTTPKSEKYKIPEMTTCPPAPKKPRNSTCLFRKRRPITFFTHPDLEKFFMFATPIRDIKGKQHAE